MALRPRPLLAAVSLGIALGTPLAALEPALAGGPGQVYVYGKTHTECANNLTSTIRLYRANDYTVTGIEACRKTGDGTRYFGYFYAN